MTLAIVAAFASQNAQATMQLVKYLMTKPAPPACATAVANYPAAYTTFSTTDTEAYLWFYVTGANTGDVFATEYYTPAGQYYQDASGPFNPLTSGGNWCFVDLPFQIAGYPPASLPGTWTVLGKYNGATIFTLQFTIGAASSCTYTLSPATASVAAGGGTGTASMTAGAGCTWTASSSVSWMTTSSSGSGNGTVSYTAAANASGTARSGAITAGGQTLTVTQGGASSSSGLPVYYRFENGTANTTPAAAGSILDSSGSAQNGTPSGSLSYSADVPVAALPLNGTANTLSMSFTSTGTVKFAGAFPLNTLAGATMEFYIKPAANSSEMDFLWTRTDGSDANRFNMGVTGASTSRSIFLDYHDPNGVQHILAGIPISGTGWTHVAVVKNGNTWTGYANGVQQGQPVTDSSPNLPNNTGWTFNGRGSVQFTGLLDEFRISNSALTPAQFLGPPGSTSSSGWNLTINQVIDTSCPSNKVIVSVTDSTGKPVTGLTTSNFTLNESGATRSITVVPVGSGSTSGAVSLAILIDTSGSLSSSDLANEKSAAKQLVAQLGSSDQAAVYTFETSVSLNQDFTSDKSKLNTAIDAITGGSSTALYLAIQTASQAMGARSGRKAIVLMTDGEDTMGGLTIDQAIAAAKTAGAPVFTVGFGSANQTILTQIATQTGGFYTGSATSTSLQSILQSIGQVLSSQYEISYTSGYPTSDNPVDISVTYNGQTSTASRTVSKCANSGTGSCTYFLQPQTLSVAAAASTGSIIVSTQAGCAVTASANVTWIHIIGASSGAVSYQIDPNTSSGQRTGTITIGNRTVPVTQDGGVSCAYSLTPATNSVGALGGTSSLRLTTPAGCAWTATVTATGTWFRLTTPTSGTGMATLIYVADANTTTQPRTAAIGVAGQTFTLTQAGGASPTSPNIADGGIVNAASNRAGTIARGSFFTIYGTNLGPAPYQQVQGYPIPDTMGGVVVTVSQGSYNKRAYLHFVSPPQINAILPSDTPPGNVLVTVNYNGNVSATATMNVVDTNFGVFSTASGPGPGIVQNYNSATDEPLNLQSYPLKPKQIAILWGTGLGPVTTGDNTPPPGGDLPVTVEVRVGGKLANKIYSGRAPTFAGVDNVYFEIPADAPTGCSVPVQINAGGVVSNTVRIAISPDGKKCQDTASPMASIPVTGAKHGTLGLMRIVMTGTIDSNKPTVNNTFDVGMGLFSSTPAGGELAFSPFMNLPPIGTCSSTSKALDAGSVIASSGLSLDHSNSTQLDAGAQLTVTGPNGSQKLQHFDPNAGSGPYVTLIGGTVPMDGAQSLPAFLDPGSYTISGPGGKDVGAFSAALTVANPLTWNNAAQLAAVNRAAGLTVTWSGGDATQSVIIAGGSTDQKTKKSGGFVCLAPVSAGTFTVPANVLNDLPPTTATIGSSDSMGMVSVMSMPLTTPPAFTAPGLDAGRLFYSLITVRAVPVQ